MKRSALMCIALFAFSLLGLAQQSVTAAISNQTPVTINVSWMPKTTVTAVTCPATVLESGSTMTCTATLNQAAPNNKSASLTTSDPTKITVPASVAIPSGALSFTFVLTAL